MCIVESEMPLNFCFRKTSLNFFKSMRVCYCSFELSVQQPNPSTAGEDCLFREGILNLKYFEIS